MEEFEDHLESCYNKLDQIIETLNLVHLKNMQKLSDSYTKSIEKLSNYKYIISDIIMSNKKQTHKIIYPRLEDLKYSGKNMIDYEKKLLEFNSPKFSEISDNLYDFPDFLVFELWKPAEICSCEHQEQDLLLTQCGKAHCRLCIEDSINSLNFTCSCGLYLSPKSVFQVVNQFDNCKDILKKLLEMIKKSNPN